MAFPSACPVLEVPYHTSPWESWWFTTPAQSLALETASASQAVCSIAHALGDWLGFDFTA